MCRIDGAGSATGLSQLDCGGSADALGDTGAAAGAEGPSTALLDRASVGEEAGPSLLGGLAPSALDPDASWAGWGTAPDPAGLHGLAGASALLNTTPEFSWKAEVAAFERETGLTADPRCVTPEGAKEVHAAFSEWQSNRTYVSAAPSDAWLAQRAEQQRWVENTYNAAYSGPVAMAAAGLARLLGADETQVGAAVELGSAIQDMVGAHQDAVANAPSFAQP